MICVECGHEMRESTEAIAETYRGKIISVEGIRHYTCDHCGDNALAPDEADRFAKIVVSRYAGEEGLLTGDEIRAIRGRLGLRQVDLERVMGVSTPTVSRWENGAMLPSRMACAFLRVLDSHPEVLDDRHVWMGN